MDKVSVPWILVSTSACPRMVWYMQDCPVTNNTVRLESVDKPMWLIYKIMVISPLMVPNDPCYLGSI